MSLPCVFCILIKKIIIFEFFKMNLKSIAFLIVILEGGALLSYEIISSKIYTPYIGSTLHVWTSILFVTLISLGISYRISQFFISKKKWGIVTSALLIAGIYLFGILFLKDVLLKSTINLEIRTAAIFTGIVLLLIPIFLMGLVTPLLAAYLSSVELDKKSQIGSVSGKMYGFGTLSGVVCTLIFLYFIIPFIGVKLSIAIIALMLITASLLSFTLIKKWK